MLQKSKHPHPLIYLKGFQSKDFASILDFLYLGQANICQEDLNSFLGIAEEIELKGWTGQTSRELLEDQKEPKHSEPAKMCAELLSLSNIDETKPIPDDALMKSSRTVAILNHPVPTSLQELDEMVKTMMEKGQKMIPHGKQANGRPKQETSSICKVSCKEGLTIHIRNHKKILIKT